MKVVERWYSPRTQRELTLARWGHYGTPVLVFPTAGGDAEEIERHHLLGHLWEGVDAGRFKVYSIDSTAGRALATHEGSPEHRAWLFNQYQQAIEQEVVPAIHSDSAGQQPIVATGSSIGAFNALACVCRYPQPVRRGHLHERHLPPGEVHPGLERRPLLLLAGPFRAGPQRRAPGPAADPVRPVRHRPRPLGGPGESWAAANVLGEKGIPNRVDVWGPEWDHDWPTWWEMLPNYLRELVP